MGIRAIGRWGLRWWSSLSRDVRYRANQKGMKEFAQSDMVGKAMHDVARDLAADANATGRSDYEAREAAVRGGRNNSKRAGAEVEETTRHFSDVRTRHLIDITNQFRMRGGG